MFKYTHHSLRKIEQILEQSGYAIRYERGNFNSGYCIVENKKIAVINKFFDTEARINCLLEILTEKKPDENLLSEQSLDFYKKIQKALSSGQGVTESESEKAK
jgi:hypothetical protein